MVTKARDVLPAELLEQWISNGWLQSQYDAHEDFFTSPDGRYSQYGVMLREEGLQVVHAELHARRARDFAANIESVAHGMLALASVDAKGSYIELGVDVENAAFPRNNDLDDASQMVVMSNKWIRGKYSNTIFTPHGSLGLKAVALRVGRSRQSGDRAAQLSLVLPQWQKANSKYEAADYVVVTIDLNGHTGAYSYSLTLPEDVYLWQVGIGKSSHRLIGSGVSMGSSVSCVDDIVGFPGVVTYLADALPQLGEYLQEMADALAGRSQQR